MEISEHLAAIRVDADRLVAAARGDLDAAVPSCPDWDARKLLRHMGLVHRWSTEVVKTRATERVDFRSLGPAPSSDESYPEWMAEGAAALLDVLASADPDDQAWNWSTRPHTARFWPRRMAHETSIHRWDAESAVGQPAPVAAELAVDGVQEAFDVFVPAGIRDKGLDAADLGGTVHLHCTDVDGEWLVRVEGGTVDIRHEHAKGDVAARGSASDLNLLLWGRSPMDAVEVHGDPAILDRLRQLASR